MQHQYNVESTTCNELTHEITTQWACLHLAELKGIWKKLLYEPPKGQTDYRASRTSYICM